MRTPLLSHVVLFASVFLLHSSPAFAHPGVGIVVDSKGNVFYTDLKHVWKISPDGSTSIAVRNVHTHELYIDAQDHLYGEHLWYKGDATKKWGHRVWRLSADGTLADIIPAREGFLDDYDDFHFIHDRRGNMYWADRGDSSFIRKRSPGGVVTTLAGGKFRNIRWMTVTAEGTVYFVDMHDLVSVSPNATVRTVMRNLAERKKASLFFNNEHAIMGLWTDSKNNVYAAVSADQAVKRISPEGRVEVATRSTTPWSPTGGLVAPNGDLWILEDAHLVGVRARKVELLQSQDKKLYICPMYCTDKVADSAIRCSVCNMEFEDKYVVEHPKDHRIIFPREAWKILQSDTSIVALDVRRASEQFQDLGRLHRSVNIPIDELERRSDELASFKDRTIISYCSHGIRSVRAAVILAKKGFQVISLQGGLTKWNRDGFPVERPKRKNILE